MVLCNFDVLFFVVLVPALIEGSCSNGRSELNVFRQYALFLYRSVPTDPAILLVLHYMFCLICSFLSMIAMPGDLSVTRSVFCRCVDGSVPVPKVLLVVLVRCLHIFSPCQIRICLRNQSALSFHTFISALAVRPFYLCPSFSFLVFCIAVCQTWFFVIHSF